MVSVGPATPIGAGLSDLIFFWVGNLDERRATSEELEAFWQAISSNEQNHRLVNLYGGFFSMCLHHGGLWGFNNGLGYSEFRNWPELAATGAAPARYYVRNLHMYLPPAQAQQIIDLDSFFACTCETCSAVGASAILGLGYHDLKKHFALARAWEKELVLSSSRDELANHLHEVEDRFNQHVGPRLPERLRPAIGFLQRWAEVLQH